MIKDTQTTVRVQACQKNLHNNPPVRSSQFPGPGVYVWRAITHQLPWLPLLALFLLWPSALPYSCCLCSLASLPLDQMEEWGRRDEDGDNSPLLWCSTLASGLNLGLKFYSVDQCLYSSQRSRSWLRLSVSLRVHVSQKHWSLGERACGWLCLWQEIQSR